MEILERPIEITTFDYLKKLPITNSSFAELNNGGITETYSTKTIINGFILPQGSTYEHVLVDDLNEAIQLTKGCVDTILKEYKNVWVRLMPQINQVGNKIAIRCRLAF